MIAHFNDDESKTDKLLLIKLRNRPPVIILHIRTPCRVMAADKSNAAKQKTENTKEVNELS